VADWLVPILVAVIGGPLMVLVQQFRRESSEQHGVLAGKIDKINDKLDSHIEWHSNIEIPSIKEAKKQITKAQKRLTTAKKANKE
jgi:hypothetical protein